MTGAGCEPSPHLYCGGCEKPRPGLEPGYVICNHFKECAQAIQGLPDTCFPGTVPTQVPCRGWWAAAGSP